MAKAARPVRCRDKWRVRWIDHEGRRQSAVFDSEREAQRALDARRTEAHEIRRGLRQRPPEDRTFNELADYWLTHRAPAKRSRDDDESIIRRHLRPVFGALLLRELSAEQIDRYTQSRAHLAAQTVRNHLTLLGSMLRLAIELRWLAALPSIRKPRADPEDELDPPWLKTQDEIRRVLEAARSEPEPLVFVLYATAVYTGMRAGELAGLRWADVDLTRRTIHVRRSFDGKTKTRASRRYVPIVDALLPILRAWQACARNELVFPNNAGNMHDPQARVFQETLHRVLDRAAFQRPTDGRAKHVIHFHSFRHTFACHWRLNGGPLEELIRVLGHTSKRMTEHYANVGGYHRPEHFRVFPAPAAESPDARTLN